MFKKVPGTRDILPEEVLSWQKIEETSRNIFSLYNYSEIRPPLIEESSLFNRSLGESTEVIQKQMFLIHKDKDIYALRPEATASIARSYIENSLDKTAGFTKLYYIGPMFRLERPQKGRLRQFHHIGCEAIGTQDAYLDAEVISLADSLLKAYSVEGYKIKINSLGCSSDKKKLAAGLRRNLKSKINKFCADCQNRFKQNVLRILDCKNESCREVISGLEIKNKYLCTECAQHFTRVKEGLDILGINYEVSPYLVRGLDYYTRSVFEIVHGNLGSQDAIGAGGRYDNLLKDLGGPDVGAIGFAFGVERLLLTMNHELRTMNHELVYLITLGEEAKKEGVKLLAKLRDSGIPCDTDYENKSLKGAMRRANDLKARRVVIIGEDELKNSSVMLKDMALGEQRQIKAENLCSELIPAQN